MKLNKNEILGENFSTATNRLKKILLFEMIKENKANYCYRCKKEIIDFLELSIEHKIPWLDSLNPKELFFSTKNISFSHKNCNSKASRYKDFNLKIASYTGLKGVSYKKDKPRTKPWFSYIFVDGKRKSIGHFHTVEEAMEAYDKEAINLHGSNALTNKMILEQKNPNSKRDKIYSQLNMSFSKASYLLKKQLFYSLLKQKQLHICYRCNNEISNCKELSIDHIEDWLSSANPKFSFYNLDNLAYSHLTCNIKAQKRNKANILT